MMRRGTLADHDVATILRQAASERLSGQIDIDGDRPAVVFLADGELSLVCWADDEVAIAVDDDADDATYSAAILTEERRLRAASRDVLGLVLARDEGWYHHHPLGEHRAAALWGWPVEEVLAEVAVRAPKPAGPAARGDSWRSTVEEEPPPADPAVSPFDHDPIDLEPGDADHGDSEPTDVVAEPVRSRDGAPPGAVAPPPDARRAAPEAIAARGAHLGEASRAVPPTAPPPPQPAPPAAPAAASPGPTPTASAGAGPRWRLAGPAPTEPLDEAAWAVVVALAGSATEADIVERLGWPEVKADIVLRSLAARGVVVAADHAPS